jgi:DNA-directed RNA polymerase specialized sigma24 family protein
MAKHISGSTPYASRADFGRVFDEDMNSLYLLGFLLTADREKAEHCFVSGLEDAVEGNPVFKEWARSWARRTIIQKAVRVIKPWPVDGSASSLAAGNGHHTTLGEERHVEMAAILGLEPFERFVYVMTVLERYSDQDCALLLNCTRRDVREARTRAFEQIGSARVFDYQPLRDASSEKPALREPCSSELPLFAAPYLATSA